MRCENRDGSVIRPGCYDSQATRLVTVIYSFTDKDSFYLCDRCYRALRREARRYGYKVRSRALPRR